MKTGERGRYNMKIGNRTLFTEYRHWSLNIDIGFYIWTLVSEYEHWFLNKDIGF